MFLETASSFFVDNALRAGTIMLKKKWHRQFKPISVFKQAETFKQLSKLTPPYLLDALIVYDPAKG